MVVKSAKQSNGYRLNVEDSKYLIFKSEDYCKKLYNLVIIAFDLIDFCEFSEDNQEKQDFYSHVSSGNLSEKFTSDKNKSLW